MKRRSFLLSLLAPALAFLGIGRDRIPGAMSIFADSLGVSEPELRSMVIEVQAGWTRSEALARMHPLTVHRLKLLKTEGPPRSAHQPSSGQPTRHE